MVLWKRCFREKGFFGKSVFFEGIMVDGAVQAVIAQGAMTTWSMGLWMGLCRPPRVREGLVSEDRRAET